MSPIPSEQYSEQLQRVGLLEDAAQKAVLFVLDRLWGDITKPQTPPSFWKRFFSLKEKQSIRGVYLHGDVGRGKTMLMDLFFQTLPQNIPARRVHFHAFMIETHDWLHARRTSGEETDLLPSYARFVAGRVRVLCLDEFFVSDVADAMILSRLFVCLFEAGVAVVMTSNQAPDHLYEGGLQRVRFLPFIALLKEKMDVVFLDGPKDYRTNMDTMEDRFFWPAHAQMHKRMDDLFTQISRGAQIQTQRIGVKGREFAVICAGDVVRFTFADLCERPHGAEDYIAIARQFRIVFIERIPRMGYDRVNEARRFMTLIDIFYEHRVHVVMTADVPPEKLCIEKSCSQAFARTISRIEEMRRGYEKNKSLSAAGDL